MNKENKNPKNKNQKNKNQKLWKTLGGNFIIWVLIIIMAVSALQFFSTDYKPKTITYSQFQEYVENGLIESGIITGRTFKGKFKNPTVIDAYGMGEPKEGMGEPKEYSSFTTILPEVTEEMGNRWGEKDIVIQYKDQTTGVFDYLIQFSPWLLIIFFWFFLICFFNLLFISIFLHN